jgi:hypothetical protein
VQPQSALADLTLDSPFNDREVDAILDRLKAPTA